LRPPVGSAGRGFFYILAANGDVVSHRIYQVSKDILFFSESDGDLARARGKGFMVYFLDATDSEQKVLPVAA